MGFYNERSQKVFATASMICGILAMVSFCMILPSIVLGGLSILFAILSTRSGQAMLGGAITGLITGGIALFIAIFVLVTSFAMVPTLMKDPAYRDYLNDLSMQMYGQSFDEMTEILFPEEIHYD